MSLPHLNPWLTVFMFLASLTFRSSEHRAWVSNFAEVKFMWNFCTTYINRASYGREEHLELYTRSIITSVLWLFPSWRFNVCRAAAEHMKLFFDAWRNPAVRIVSRGRTELVTHRSSSAVADKKQRAKGSGCCCLLFVAGSRWFNNVRKGAVNLGAMHFTSSSCFN